MKTPFRPWTQFIVPEISLQRTNLPGWLVLPNPGISFLKLKHSKRTQNSTNTPQSERSAQCINVWVLFLNWLFKKHWIRHWIWWFLKPALEQKLARPHTVKQTAQDENPENKQVNQAAIMQARPGRLCPPPWGREAVLFPQRDQISFPPEHLPEHHGPHLQCAININEETSPFPLQKTLPIPAQTCGRTPAWVWTIQQQSCTAFLQLTLAHFEAF